MGRWIWFVLLFPLSALGAGELSPSFTLDGNLYRDRDQFEPLLESNVRLRIQILNGDKSCSLYEEQQFADLSATQGYFNIKVGSVIGATKRVSGADPGNSMVAIYQNTVAIPARGCAGNSSPAVANSSRYLRIYVLKNSGSFEELLDPDIEIGSMPQASVAQTLQGYSPTSFLILGPGDLTQANLQNLFVTGNVQKLTDILNSYGVNGTIKVPANSSDPGGSQAGEIWYDSVSNELKYFNGTSHVALGVSGGTQVTSVTAATPLVSSGGATPEISIPKATASVHGYLDSSDWSEFNNKLSGATVFAGDVSGTASTMSVDTVGGSTAANIHAATGLANGATPANTVSTIVRRDSSGNFSAGTISGNLSGALILPSEGGGASTVSLQGPATAGTSYVVKWPNIQGAATEVLTNDGNGNLSWATPSTTATSYSGILPIINGGTNSSTALTNNKIMISSGGSIVESASLTNGQIMIGSTGATPVVANLTAGAGINITNGAGSVTIATSGLQSTNLEDGKILIGNGLDVATAVTPSQDISFSNLGVTQVNRIQNRIVNSAPVSGGILSWDVATTSWVGKAFPACNSGQTPYWNSTSDSIVCQPIQVGVSEISGTLGVGSGGTGATTLTDFGILMGNGTAAITAIAPSTANYVLTSNGAGVAPSWQAPLLSGSSGTPNYVARWTASTTLGVGTLFDNGTSVGVGTATPRSALDVQGVILGKPAVVAAASTIDFSSGNIQYTNSNCGSFQFNYLKDGGSYTFIVKGTTSAVCTFTAYAGNGPGSGNIVVHMPPDHAETVENKHTIYNLIVAGSDAYLAWTPGY